MKGFKSLHIDSETLEFVQTYDIFEQLDGLGLVATGYEEERYKIIDGVLTRLI